MKKVIKLSESDLTRIVKRVIKESGYQGIKNDLEYESGIYSIAEKLANEIYNFIETKNQLKSILRGDSYEYNKSSVFKNLFKKFTIIAKKMESLQKLLSLFEEREMILTKSDLGDYGFEISDLLDSLEDSYNEVEELKDITTDEDVLGFLEEYENNINEIVDLLDNIPN